MPDVLLAFDTDRIKDYVFATGKLKEIRGASALLDRLNRQTMLELVGEADEQASTIYANGGAGLFRLDAARGQDALNVVQRVYREQTHTASVTGVMVPLPAGFREDDDVRPYMTQIGLRLRAGKDRSPTHRVITTHSYLRTCDSCGELYAARTITGPDGTEQLCLGCFAKRETEKREKHLWGRLEERLRAASYPLDDRRRPDDFEAIGEQSRPKGYFGLIYADGDDMGRQIDTLKTLLEVEQFSQAVDDSIHEAVAQAIQNHLLPDPDRPDLPFDVLLLGGDDLVMVTTAHAALETALTVVEAFPHLTKERWRQPLSLSAAVVLAHVNFPFRSLVGLASSALKFAKKQRTVRRRVDPSLTGGVLNFLVVSSANHLDFEDYYKETLQASRLVGDNQREIIERTVRPYRPADFRRLMQATHELARAPRGKLEQLRAAVLQSRYQAMLDGIVLLSRWRDQEEKAAVRRLVEHFSPSRPIYFPWYREENTYRTPLLDLVELLDFLPRR